jgi:hypothetical protein
MNLLIISYCVILHIVWHGQASSILFEEMFLKINEVSYVIFMWIYVLRLEKI